MTERLQAACGLVHARAVVPFPDAGDVETGDGIRYLVHHPAFRFVTNTYITASAMVTQGRRTSRLEFE